MARPSVHLIIRGRVQGVGFRAWAAGEAQRLDLDGWVRNRSDGSVEILALGPGDRLERMVEACRRGPPAAVVASVETGSEADDGSLGFIYRPTA